MKDRGIILITMFIVILDAYFLGYKSAFQLCIVYYIIDLINPFGLFINIKNNNGRNK